MKVDFNNIRRRALAAHNKLVELLNEHIISSDEVLVSVDSLRRPMESLRQYLVAIALSYDEGNPDMQDVLGDEIVPEFAPEEE